MPNSASSFDKETKIKNINFLSLAIPLLIALWFSIVYFGNYINPKSFSQLPQNVREEHITSLFFRADLWHFPITITQSIGEGIPLSLTDSIPLIAILFKLFNIQTMQYFGFWIIFSYILMAFFAYRISKNISNNSILSSLGSILFLTLPFSWYHTSYIPWMAGQWIILWAYSLFFKKKRYTSIEWYGVIIISCLIHPYFTFICFFIMSSDIFHLYIYNHSISVVKAASTFSYLLTTTLCVLSVSGLFYLTTLVSPNSPIPFSMISQLKNYNIFYNNIGIGTLFGLCISFIMIIQFRKTKKYIRYYLPLISTLIIFLFISLSNGIIIKNHILYLPLGSWFYQYIAPIFTSSIHFLLPIFWLTPIILIQTISILEKRQQYLGTFILMSIILIQLFTFNPPIYQEKNSFISLPEEAQEFLSNTKKITWIFYNDIPLRPNFYEQFAYYAYQNNISINMAPLIRYPTHYLSNLSHSLELFTNQIFIPHTTYIISKDVFPNEYHTLGKSYTLSNIILFKPHKL